jgi:hypothetical protein
VTIWLLLPAIALGVIWREIHVYRRDRAANCVGHTEREAAQHPRRGAASSFTSESLPPGRTFNGRDEL